MDETPEITTRTMSPEELAFARAERDRGWRRCSSRFHGTTCKICGRGIPQGADAWINSRGRPPYLVCARHRNHT